MKKSKLLYETQQYSQSLKLLTQIQECVDDEKNSYLWGRMENEIMLGKVEDAWKSM
jgi:hypothetical protein